MAIELIDGLDIRKNVHVDKRIVQPSSVERDLININYRYEGLTVYCLDTKKEWRLEAGITNAHWVEKLSGGGTFIDPGTNITITGTGTVGDPFVINTPDAIVPDGSETKINAGTNVSITGTGTVADPYVVVTAPEVISGTYTVIKALLSTNSLVIGQQYHITDFETIYLLPNSINTSNLTGTRYEGNTEGLILTATAINRFDNVVLSTTHANDIIHYDIHDELDVLGTTRKGWITYRKDTEYNISTPFDFRNAKARRYEGSVASPVDETHWMYAENITLYGEAYVANTGSFVDISIVAYTGGRLNDFTLFKTEEAYSNSMPNMTLSFNNSSITCHNIEIKYEDDAVNSSLYFNVGYDFKTILKTNVLAKFELIKNSDFILESCLLKGVKFSRLISVLKVVGSKLIDIGFTVSDIKDISNSLIEDISPASYTFQYSEILAIVSSSLQVIGINNSRIGEIVGCTFTDLSMTKVNILFINSSELAGNFDTVSAESIVDLVTDISCTLTSCSFISIDDLTLTGATLVNVNIEHAKDSQINSASVLTDVSIKLLENSIINCTISDTTIIKIADTSNIAPVLPYAITNSQLGIISASVVLGNVTYADIDFILDSTLQLTGQLEYINFHRFAACDIAGKVRSSQGKTMATVNMTAGTYIQNSNVSLITADFTNNAYVDISTINHGTSLTLDNSSIRESKIGSVASVTMTNGDIRACNFTQMEACVTTNIEFEYCTATLLMGFSAIKVSTEIITSTDFGKLNVMGDDMSSALLIYSLSVGKQVMQNTTGIYMVQYLVGTTPTYYAFDA